MANDDNNGLVGGDTLESGGGLGHGLTETPVEDGLEGEGEADEDEDVSNGDRRQHVYSGCFTDSSYFI